MTPVQIAYFKHFMYDAGLNKMFVYRYRHHRVKDGGGENKGNPESLEQFFRETPVDKVLMKAFYFEVGSQYGHDFWEEINEKWLKYWELYEDNLNNTKYMTLKGSFSILRQNWDLPQFWKNLESVEDTYKRMGIEPPIPEEARYTLCKFKIGDIIQSSISEEILTVVAITGDGYEMNDGGIIEFDKEDYWDLIDEAVTDTPEEEAEVSSEPESIEEKQKPMNDGSPLEGFSLVETRNPHGGNRIGVNEVSINMRSGGYRMTFSTKKSDLLRRSGYRFVKLLTKKETEEIALIFNHHTGCKISIKKNPTKENRNVTVNSKDIVEHIHKFYNLKKTEDYYFLDITATIQQDDNTIFKLKLQ